MTRTDKFVLASLLGLLMLQGCANLVLLSKVETVQLASAKAQIASSNLDKEVAEMLMRIDKNTRKGN